MSIICMPFKTEVLYARSSWQSRRTCERRAKMVRVDIFPPNYSDFDMILSIVYAVYFMNFPFNFICMFVCAANFHQKRHVPNCRRKGDGFCQLSSQGESVELKVEFLHTIDEWLCPSHRILQTLSSKMLSAAQRLVNIFIRFMLLSMLWQSR